MNPVNTCHRIPNEEPTCPCLPHTGDSWVDRQRELHAARRFARAKAHG